jgi:hypothetical protein
MYRFFFSTHARFFFFAWRVFYPPFSPVLFFLLFITFLFDQKNKKNNRRGLLGLGVYNERRSCIVKEVNPDVVGLVFFIWKYFHPVVFPAIAALLNVK